MSASKGILSYKTCANINLLTLNSLNVGKFGMLLRYLLLLLLFKRLDNASVANHSPIITLKENLQVRELMIYKYNYNSSKSITSVSFHKKCGLFEKN